MDIAKDPASQAQLAIEVEALRARYPDTQELYREVCALLFFRHGVTPTANKLYQLVRKGSMSAPAEALARFWENLREKSRVRIEHPDLPPELAQSAGEMLGALWQRAQSSAQAGFTEAMAATRKAVAEAEAQAATELARAESAALALFQLQAEFSASLTRTQEIEHARAREQGLREALEKQLASAISQRRELQEALAGARRDFEAQLALQREVARELETRLQADLMRLTGEAERERALAAEALRELEESRHAARHQTAESAQALDRLQSEVSQLRQQLGLSEGAVAELRAARDYLQRQWDRSVTGGRAPAGRRRGRIVGRVGAA